MTNEGQKTEATEDRESWFVYRGGWKNGYFSVGPDGFLYGKKKENGSVVKHKLGNKGIIPIVEYDIQNKQGEISKAYYKLKFATEEEDRNSKDKYVTATTIVSSREFQGYSGERNKAFVLKNIPEFRHYYRYSKKTKILRIFDSLVSDQAFRIMFIKEKKALMINDRIELI
jgi:hypothetical protein